MNDNVFDYYDKDKPDYPEICDECDGELPNCYCWQVDNDHDAQNDKELE